MAARAADEAMVPAPAERPAIPIPGPERPALEAVPELDGPSFNAFAVRPPTQHSAPGAEATGELTAGPDKGARANA